MVTMSKTQFDLTLIGWRGYAAAAWIFASGVVTLVVVVAGICEALT